MNPSESSGFEGETISKQTISEFSGSVSFGETGWQGYDGYYCTIGKGGSVLKSSETDIITMLWKFQIITLQRRING